MLKYVGFVQPVNDVPVLDQPEKVFNGMFVMITIIPMIGLALAAVPMIFNDYTGKKEAGDPKKLLRSAGRKNMDNEFNAFAREYPSAG